jgi:hypothetical protein
MIKDLPESEKAKYLESVLKDRTVLVNTINELIRNYSERHCRQMPANPPS